MVRPSNLGRLEANQSEKANLTSAATPPKLDVPPKFTTLHYASLEE
jgi:hypothetical protein